MGLWCGILNYGKLPAPTWKPIGGRHPAAGTAAPGTAPAVCDSGQSSLPMSWHILLLSHRAAPRPFSGTLSTCILAKGAVARKKTAGAFAQPAVATCPGGFTPLAESPPSRLPAAPHTAPRRPGTPAGRTGGFPPKRARPPSHSIPRLHRRRGCTGRSRPPHRHSLQSRSR